MGSQSQGSSGMLQPWSTWGEFNNIAFAIQQALARMQTATLVRIERCTNSGELSPVGLVDVTPLVNQIDGQGNGVEHVTIYGLPYMRMQGGSNAVVIDPQPGDIGVAVFASRDISKVKNTKAQANPGSFRSYDFADGLYLGGMLNGVPQQYVQFSAAGVKIVSPLAITLQAPVIALDGSLSITGGDATISGKITASGDVTSNGVSLTSHVHTSAAPGNPTSEPLP